MGRNQNSHSGLTRRELLKYGIYGYGGLAAGLSSSLWLTGCRKQHRDKRPNVILISVDTLRPDHLSCYGYHRGTSPYIDQFAKDALVFDNCLSHAPVTGSSIASILSGFLPHETKVFKNLPLATAVETLPEILQRQGYKTAAVVSNYVLRRKKGWAKGFMIYDDTMSARELVRDVPERIAEHTTDTAVELLKQLYQDRMFMWIHYQDPHGPYTPPPGFAKMFHDADHKPHNIKLNKTFSGRGGIPSYQKLDGNSDFHYYVSQYDGEICYQDKHFQRLITVLEELGVYDDTLIVFTSDHGEGMGEHNYFFAHGENLYNSLTHVPLIMKYGRELTGRRTDYVQHLDIVPTVLKAVGIKVDSRFRGLDVRERQGTNREIFAEMESPPFLKKEIKFSLVRDGLKLIYTSPTNQYELFDLKTDPHEERNLVNNAKYQKKVENLKIRLKYISQENFLDPAIVNKPQKLTDEEIEKLKSLGYTQ